MPTAPIAFSRTFSILTLAMFLAGCDASASSAPKTGSVTGVVTMNGNPLPGVMVGFQPQGKAPGGPSSGKTNAEGRYELIYNGSIKGAVVGTHRVTVTTSTAGPDPKFVDPIPPKYNSLSELTEIVKAGANVIDLKLLSK